MIDRARVRQGALLLVLPILGLAAVLALRLVVYKSPAEAPDDEPVTFETSVEQNSVQLSRPEIVAAAGIEVAAVQTSRLQSTITCPGIVSFNSNAYVKLAPKAAGIVQEIHVDVGAQVRAGQLLAVLHSQALGDVKASLIKAHIHEEHARWQIDRFQQAAEGVAAKNLFEARHMLEEDLADKGRLVDRLTEFGFTPSQIETIAEGHDRSITLSVLAPRAGTIVDRHAVEGEAVDTGTTLFAIADLETMWVHLAIYPNLVQDVSLGQAITFKPDGMRGELFTGKIGWISPEVDAQTRTIRLRAEVANRDGLLRANMYGTGELKINDPESRLVVPQLAVQTIDGAPVVFVLKPDNRFEVRHVQIGVKRDALWEVTEGLAVGERVATTGSFLLKSNAENPDFGKVE